MLKINNQIVKTITIAQILEHYHNGDVIEGAEIYMKLPKALVEQPVPSELGYQGEAILKDVLFCGGDTKNMGKKIENTDSVIFLITNELHPTVQTQPLGNTMLRLWFDTFLPLGAEVATRSSLSEI